MQFSEFSKLSLPLATLATSFSTYWEVYREAYWEAYTLSPALKITQTIAS